MFRATFSKPAPRPQCHARSRSLCTCQYNQESAMWSRRCCFLVDLAIGLKPPVQSEFQSGIECVFCLVSKWIKSFSFLFCLVGIFVLAYVCEDWLSYRLPLSCYLITAVAAGLVSIFDSWLHKKKICYSGQDPGRTCDMI